MQNVIKNASACCIVQHKNVRYFVAVQGVTLNNARTAFYSEEAQVFVCSNAQQVHYTADGDLHCVLHNIADAQLQQTFAQLL